MYPVIHLYHPPGSRECLYCRNVVDLKVIRVESIYFCGGYEARTPRNDVVMYICPECEKIKEGIFWNKAGRWCMNGLALAAILAAGIIIARIAKTALLS